MPELTTYMESYRERNEGPCRFDNTRFVDYDKCPRYFYFRHVLGWEIDATAHALVFGAAFHEAMDHYYKLYFFGDDRPYPPKVIAEVAWMTFREHFEAEIPISMQRDPRTSDTARSLLHKYANTYEKETFVIEDPRHIEIGFCVPLPGVDDLLVGRCDAICKHPNLGYAVLEHKTTSQMGKSFLSMFRPNNQVTGYVYGARFYFDKVYGALVNGVQVAKTKSDMVRIPTSRTDDELDDFAHQIAWKAQRIKSDRVWPQNTSSCSYYGKCSFHDLCMSGRPVSVWDKRRYDPPHGYTTNFWEPWRTEKEENQCS